jgi:vitamin B12 transporter
MKPSFSRHALAAALFLSPCIVAAQTTAPASTASSSTDSSSPDATDTQASIPTPSRPVTRLGEVVVTASRTPEPASDVIGDVTVIDRQQLQQAGQESLADVLGQQYGIETSSRGGPQAVTGVSIRGAETDQTLVLVDGVPINGATSGQTAFGALPTASIDHVEILRGSASSLYGANAIGGVINIITRKGGDRPLSAQASVGVGTYGTSQYTTSFAGSKDGWTYSLGSSYGQSHGYNATNHNSPSYNPDKDSYYSRNLNGSLGYEWKKGQTLTFQGYNTRINGGYDGTSIQSPSYPYNDRVIQTLDLYSLTSENQLTNDWKSTLRYAYTEDENTSKYRDFFTGALQNDIIRTRQNQYTWQNDFNFSANQNLTLLYEHLDQQVSGTIDYDKSRRHNDAVGGVYRADFGRNHIQASLRNDDDSQFGSEATWGVSYGFDLTQELRAYVAANTGYKTPTFNDLYYPGAGNPNLEPEKSDNAEIGLRYTGDTVILSAVAYQNKIRDLISYDLADSTTYNVGKARIRGITLTAEKDFTNTTLRASADISDPDDETNGTQLARRARHIYKVSADHRFGAWTMGGEYQFVSYRFDDAANDIRLGGYGLFNLTAGYEFNKHFAMHVRWDNVLDKDYTTVYGYNNPGSNVFVNLTWKM